MAIKFAILAACLAIVNASILPVLPVAYTIKSAEVEQDSIPNYHFNYGVSDALTGDHKSQQETRNGDVVQGSYSVVDPDGTKRTVHYTADDVNGFNAVVEKEPIVAQAAAVVAAPVVHEVQPAVSPVVEEVKAAVEPAVVQEVNSTVAAPVVPVLKTVAAPIQAYAGLPAVSYGYGPYAYNYVRNYAAAPVVQPLGVGYSYSYGSPLAQVYSAAHYNHYGYPAYGYPAYGYPAVSALYR